MADTDPQLQPGELFELECVDDDGALFTVYLVAEVGATFSDVWRAVPRLKKTIDRVVDVSRIAQISTLAEVRQLNAAHDDDH
jgi:hypothetical protein